MNNAYLSVGSWNFTPREKGIGVYQLPGGAPVQRMLPDVNVGQQFADRERGILYITHESDKHHGGDAPGGDVIALKWDKHTGTFAVLNETGSAGSKPSYVWMDKSRDYLLVSHHAGRNPVVKVEKNALGSYEVVAQYDDTTLVLFRLKENGSIGQVSDVINYQGTNIPGLHCRSHLHCIVGSPDGGLYIACDKGLDKVYSYRIDRENGKLVQLDTAVAEDRSAPRYAVFHPTLAVVYVNHEEKNYLSAYRYDENGKLALLEKVDMLDTPAKSQPSDLLVSADGRMLYATLRGVDQIAVFRLDGSGKTERVQNISCGGKTPRGIALSPDGTYLLSANQDSDIVSMLKIQPDGLLEEPEVLANGDCPGNLSVWEVQA